MRILPENLAEINIRIVKREVWFWIGLGLFLYGIGSLMDFAAFPFIQEHLRTVELDQFSIFLTEQLIWAILLAFAVVTGYRAWTNPDHHTKLVPALFAVLSTGILAFTFKSLFDVDRPFVYMDILPLVDAPSTSFPSAHTAIAFALLIPFFRISKVIGSLWLLFALLIGFARVYQNVHFPSDIAGGVFLGGLIGSFFSNPEVKKVLVTYWQELEFRRQTFHFLAGFLCVFAHWAGFFRLRVIAFFLITGLIISFISQHKKENLISRILSIFDRPRDQNFPGRGAFYFLLGVFLVFLFFREENIRVAYASIMILSVGDSLNHLFDKRASSKVRLPWNKRKNFPGLIIGILSGTFAAQFFVPIIPAFLASSLAIVGETIPLKFGKHYIDDNIFVPLVAANVLWVFT